MDKGVAAFTENGDVFLIMLEQTWGAVATLRDSQDGSEILTKDLVNFNGITIQYSAKMNNGAVYMTGFSTDINHSDDIGSSSTMWAIIFALD